MAWYSLKLYLYYDYSVVFSKSEISGNFGKISNTFSNFFTKLLHCTSEDYFLGIVMLIIHDDHALSRPGSQDPNKSTGVHLDIQS